MYAVLYKPNARTDIPYEPEGGEVECDRETAEERHRELIRRARDGETIGGLLPQHVRVQDLETGQVCLSEYAFAAHPDDPAPRPMGPWSELN